jgi:prephenate dehydratase
MQIYCQWIWWSYSFNASETIKRLLNKKSYLIEWCSNFNSVWDKIWKADNLWVLPVENSYAGNVHTNLYNFLKYDYKIIWEYNLKIRHCLLSNETDIKKIKEVYAHPQSLNQCYKYLKTNKIKENNYWDNWLAAKMVSESNKKWIWAIASIEAWELYNLNILDKDLQDQKWNTTRFFLVTKKDSEIKYNKKKNKITIIFEAKDIPSSLYKCLWAFATNSVNLSKIESLPSYSWPFSYLFWLDFRWNLKDENVKKALEELDFFTSFIKVLWEY